MAGKENKVEFGLRKLLLRCYYRRRKRKNHIRIAQEITWSGKYHIRQER
ncbi:hypothetical protein [Mediterraneibacter gnavus]|nr:hypothetical protein [Mediterraneibacter gnavus]